MGRDLKLSLIVLLPLLAGALAAPGCSNKETITQPIIIGAPKLVASPDTLYIVDSSPTASAWLSTDAPGTLTWRVTGRPSWASASPESGQVTQTLRAVTITASAQGLNVGTHGGTLVFHSGGGEEHVYVRFSVAEHPNGVASVSSLHFDGTEIQKSFILTNQGTGFLIWSVSSAAGWLDIGPSQGFLGAGQSTTLYAYVNRGGQPVGTASGSLTITSNSEGGPIGIPVTMDVPAAPQLGTSPDTVRFNYFVNAASFRVWNSGNAPLTWNAAAFQPYVQLASTGGTVNPGDTTTVDVTVDRAGLATGTYASSITVTAGALPARTVGVSLKHFFETKWLLDAPLTDAEYDRAHDRIVAVGGGSSPRLFVLDPVARSMSSVVLPLDAACVSIRPDGLFAAAGHNGLVSYVNLTSMAVERTYATTTDAIDVVLPSNGWVYAFPRTDQWELIRCVNLTTGVETLNTGRQIYARTLAKLHPSGDYIYGANNGLSPSDFEKYDIRSGTAIYMYDSPYHGDYAFSGDLWFTDNGDRIFARSGNVFRSSTTQGQDMTYNGNLAGAPIVQWVEHSTAASRIFCLLADSFQGAAPPELRVYDPAFLAFRGTKSLPPFLVPNGSGGGTLYNSGGHFAFVNAAGTKVHVLVQAAAGSGLLNDWATVSFDVSALP